jgi:hypothetical protein
MVPATQQWEPRAFYGAPGGATAFFGYFFWLLQKKCLAVKGETHKNNPRTQAASKREFIKRRKEYLARGARTAKPD